MDKIFSQPESPPGTRQPPEPGTPWTRHPPEQAPPGPGTPQGPCTPPVDRHTPVNILPCPKLRLQVVIILDRSTSQMKQPKSYHQVYQIAPPSLIAPNTMSDNQHPGNNPRNSQNCTFETNFAIKCIRFGQMSL